MWYCSICLTCWSSLHTRHAIVVIVLRNTVKLLINTIRFRRVGRNSSVGIATRYELDGPGIESRWGRGFAYTSRTTLGTNPESCTMGTGSFQEVKRAGWWVDRPSLSSAQVKERVGLYLFPPLGLSILFCGKLCLSPLNFIGCWRWCVTHWQNLPC
jgi:hypothetical protein